MKIVYLKVYRSNTSDKSVIDLFDLLDLRDRQLIWPNPFPACQPKLAARCSDRHIPDPPQRAARAPDA